MAEEPSREQSGDMKIRVQQVDGAQNIAGYRSPVFSLCHGEVPLT